MSIARTDQDTAAAHGKIIAKAWSDPAFKAKLLADPHGALKDAGVAVPPGMTVKVVENTDTHVDFVLSATPADKSLGNDELEGVAGGAGIMQVVSQGPQN